MMKMRLFRRIGRRVGAAPRQVPPVEGYDLWAETYDTQPDNVVFALESPLFSELLARVPIAGKTVVDIGCGTGRHWPEILSHSPAELTGVDPSPRMLERLKARYPHARTVCAEGDHLPEIADASCDLIISTLALAHIPSAERALGEWRRILRLEGAMLITDFHPSAIRAGMKRTFVSEGRTIELEHYATGLDRLRHIATGCGLTADFVAERAIDESVRPLFERAQHLEMYEKHKRQPLVFGLHFHKTR